MISSMLTFGYIEHRQRIRRVGSDTPFMAKEKISLPVFALAQQHQIEVADASKCAEYS
jgi:hypothetical protein